MKRWFKWGLYSAGIGLVLMILAFGYSRSCAGMFCGLGAIMIVSPIFLIVVLLHLNYLTNSIASLPLFFILNIIFYFIPGALIGWIVTQVKSEETKTKKTIMILAPIIIISILVAIPVIIISSIHNSGVNNYMKEHNTKSYGYWSCLIQCPTQENSGYTQNHFFNQTIFEQTCESNCNNLYPSIPNVSPGIGDNGDFLNYYDSSKAVEKSKEFQTCFALGGRAEAEKFKSCLINALPIIKERFNIN